MGSHNPLALFNHKGGQTIKLDKDRAKFSTSVLPDWKGLPSAVGGSKRANIVRRGLGWATGSGEISLEIFKRSPDHTIKSLIEWGTQGHYPLFDRDWLEALNPVPGKRLRALSTNQKGKVKTILKRLSSQASFERKRTVLFSLSPEDRSTFIRAFMNAVEHKILDTSPELH